MIGLDYLCSINNISYSELAKKMNMSRQAVTNWIAGRRNINKKYYEKLREIFGEIPYEYFNKKLTELDKKYLLEISQLNLGTRFNLSESNQKLQNILHKINYKINSNEDVQKDDIKSVINDLIQLL